MSKVRKLKIQLWKLKKLKSHYACAKPRLFYGNFSITVYNQ